MPILLDPKEAVRFEPEGQALPEGRRLAYWLRVPTVYDGPALTRAVRAAGGRQWSLAQKLGALRAGIRELCGDDAETAERQLGKVEGFAGELEAFQADCASGAYGGESPDQAAAFRAALERWAEADGELGLMMERVADGWPRLMDMLADDAAWPEIRGIEAARLFLAGWENVDAAFARDRRSGVPPALLARVPRHHRVLIGFEVERLMRPTETQAKNSDSPSPGSSDEPTSTAASAGPPTTPG